MLLPRSLLVPKYCLGLSLQMPSASIMEDSQQDGYLTLKKNDVILNRYQVQKQIGKGTFGTVYACTDTNTQDLVAIKILRSKNKYFLAGQCELACLNAIQLKQQQQMKQRQQLGQAVDVSVGSQQQELLDELELEDSNQLPQLIGVFNIQSPNQSGKHLCLVFPLYGPSLLNLLKANEYRGYNVDWTREMSRSFLKGVASLHSLGGIHSDVKVENIVSRRQSAKTQVRERVFVHPPGADLILIDVGSAIFPGTGAPTGVNKVPPKLVCTRQYRPPEVTLGLPYNQKLDIWSCGCVIFEVLTGKTLFMTHDAVVHMFLIQQIIGPPPRAMIKVAIEAVGASDSDSKHHIDAELQALEKQGNYTESPAIVLRAYDGRRNRWDLPPRLAPAEARSAAVAKPIEQELTAAPNTLIHLLRWMLAWDPAERPTAAQVLRHPFFAQPAREARGVQVGNSGESEGFQAQKWGAAIQALVDGKISLTDFRSWWLNDAK